MRKPEKFDCSELFFECETSTASVLDDTVIVTITEDSLQVSIEMDINKIANFLEQCRRRQALQ